MRAHLVKDGVIVNTVEVANLSFMDGLVDASIGGAIGDSISNGLVVKNTPVPVVPQSVPMANARYELIKAGKMADVNSYFAALTGIEGDIARTAWDFEPSVNRSNPYVIAAAAAVGLNESQLDDLFIAAGNQ